MAQQTNASDIIKDYFFKRGTSLSGPNSICCGEIQFEKFTYSKDGRLFLILFFAGQVDTSVIQQVIQEIADAELECLIVKSDNQEYHKTLNSKGWKVYLLREMEEAMEQNIDPKTKEKKKVTGETKQLMDDSGKLLRVLRAAIENASKDFIRTTPICTYVMNGRTVSFDLRDILLVGAVAQADVLLTGKTGSGKTRLANAVMKGLFGDVGYYSKTTLPTMTPSEFMDINFEKIKSGGSLTEAIEGIPALERAGIVLNEVNRAPGIIQNMMIAFLDKEFEVQGKPVPMGRAYDNDRRYQMRILTINEGGVYNVENLDPAIRDRMTIEVPVDAFPQSREDVLQMIDTDGCDFPDAPDNFDNVIQLHKLLRKVTVSDECKKFLAYLAGMSYCIVAPRGNKESINLSAETCETCTHIGLFNRICFSVRAPSARIILQLQEIARAFALLRCWKDAQAGMLQVEHEDIVEAAPFVLFSKLSLDEKWVRTSSGAHGDRWTAIRNLVDWIYKERFVITQSRDNPIYAFLEAKQNNSPITKQMLDDAYEYVMKQDPWTYNPATLVLEFKKMQGVKQ